MGTVFLSIGDPELVQDMYTTKNAILDKTGTYKGVFQNFFGESFLFSKTDEKWKAKRRGLGHAFYKEKLIALLSKLKLHLHNQCMVWVEEARKSPTGTTTIDISKAIIRIKQRFLMHITLG